MADPAVNGMIDLHGMGLADGLSEPGEVPGDIPAPPSGMIDLAAMGLDEGLGEPDPRHNSGPPSIYDQVEAAGIGSDVLGGAHQKIKEGIFEASAGAYRGLFGVADMLLKYGKMGIDSYRGIAKLIETGDLQSAAALINQLQADAPATSVATDFVDAAIDETAKTLLGVDAPSPFEGPMPQGMPKEIMGAFGEVFGPGVLGLTSVAQRDLGRSAGVMAELMGFGSYNPASQAVGGGGRLLDQTVPVKRLTDDEGARLFPESTIAPEPPAGSQGALFPDTGLAPDAPVGTQGQIFPEPAQVADGAPVRLADDIDTMDIPTPTGNRELDAHLALSRGDGSVAGVGYRLDEAGNLVRHKADDAVMRAGWDRGTIGALKAVGEATRQSIRRMAQIARSGMENKLFKGDHRPGDVIGNRIDRRMRIIRSANMKAGKSIDEIAKTQMRGQVVDISGPWASFLDGLEDARIRIGDDGVLDFSDSNIKGPEMSGPRAILETVYDHFKTMSSSHDAYDVHWSKRLIDEQVTYGKKESGLSGKLSTLIKGLRHGIDTVLDEAFPDYNEANTIYSETVGMIDDMQRLTGHFNDLGRQDLTDMEAEAAAKALGLMSRKILSNYRSSTEIGFLLDTIEDASHRLAPYVGETTDILQDDIRHLVVAEGAMRDIIPSIAQSNTLQGIVQSTASQDAALDAAELIAGGPGMFARAGMKIARKGVEQLKGEQDVAKIEALQKWLDDLDEVVQPNNWRQNQ